MVICSYVNTCKMYIIHIPQISEYINIKYFNASDPIGALGTIGHNTRTSVFCIYLCGKFDLFSPSLFSIYVYPLPSIISIII